MVECEFSKELGSIERLHGFNRYMVECEYIRRTNTRTGSEVLIDTWWNVNVACKFTVGKVGTFLIDTWWNVNINFSGKMAQMTTF